MLCKKKSQLLILTSRIAYLGLQPCSLEHVLIGVLDGQAEEACSSLHIWSLIVPNKKSVQANESMTVL